MGGKTQKIVCGIGKAAASAAIGLIFGECGFVSGSLLCARLLVYEICSLYACSRRRWHRKMCADSTHSPVVGDLDASLTTAASVVSCIGSDTQPSFVCVCVWITPCSCLSIVHLILCTRRMGNCVCLKARDASIQTFRQIYFHLCLSISLSPSLQRLVCRWFFFCFSVAIVAFAISSSFSAV